MADRNDEAIRELVQEWLRWARADLAVAEIEDRRVAPAIRAFHAQQATEKALKALLVRRQVEFPRIHALGPLLELCKSSGFSGTEALIDAVTLTRYAVATRYPGEAEPITEQDAADAAILAAQAVTWAEQQVQKSFGM